ALESPLTSPGRVSADAGRITSALVASGTLTHLTLPSLAVAIDGSLPLPTSRGEGHYTAMTTPLRIPPSELWSMRIEHPYSLLVREGGFAWSCGQCPLSAEGAVLAPDDLAAQAGHVDGYIRRLLDKAGY